MININKTEEQSEPKRLIDSLVDKSDDQETDSSLTFRDMDNLSKKPIRISPEQVSLYNHFPAFQRPAMCPGCLSWILRDFGVVNNRVRCPNEACSMIFCWICLDDAKESDECRDHFSPINMFSCFGCQFKDVRENSVLTEFVQRLLVLISLPLWAIISSIVHSVHQVQIQT